MQIGRVKKTHYVKGRAVGTGREIGLIEYDKGEKLICYIIDVAEKQKKIFSVGDLVKFDYEKSFMGYEAKDIEKVDNNF